MPVTFTLEYAEKLNRESESRRITKVLGKDRAEEPVSVTGRGIGFDLSEKKHDFTAKIEVEEGWLLNKKAPAEAEKEPLPEISQENVENGLTIEKQKRKYVKKAKNA